MLRVSAAIFDAYGTLLDVHAAMSRHAARLGPNWRAISADWRTKQIEFIWVRSLAGVTHYCDFWRLTEEALWAAARHGVTDRALLADVPQAYRQLDAFADAAPVLRRLHDAGVNRAILSNGEPGMPADAVHAGDLEPLLDVVLSVEGAGVFKPDSRAYHLATECFGLPAERMAFVSSNPWDAFGARGLRLPGVLARSRWRAARIRPCEHRNRTVRSRRASRSTGTVIPARVTTRPARRSPACLTRRPEITAPPRSQ